MRSLADIAFLQCFQTHLQAAVRYVSPLALEVVSAEGLGFNDALNDLRPGPAWLRGSNRLLLAARSEPGPFGRAASDVNPMLDHHAEWLAPAQAVAALRPRSSPAGHAGIRVVDRAIEVIATIGDCHLSTQGGFAWLTLSHRLPDALKLACVGRQVSELVDSTMFSGRDYPVGAAFDIHAPGGPTVLAFHTGLAERAMPWPELHLI